MASIFATATSRTYQVLKFDIAYLQSRHLIECWFVVNAYTEVEAFPGRQTRKWDWVIASDEQKVSR